MLHVKYAVEALSDLRVSNPLRVIVRSTCTDWVSLISSPEPGTELTAEAEAANGASAEVTPVRLISRTTEAEVVHDASAEVDPATRATQCAQHWELTHLHMPILSIADVHYHLAIRTLSVPSTA